ncbi:MAG: hypothetical protein AAF251_12515 [Pseudomonadota bacterium]
MIDPVTPAPLSVRTLYSAGLLASALSYLGIVGLVGLSVALGSGSVGTVLGAMLFGWLYTLLPALLIAALITAPLGAVIGRGLARFAMPPAALGALSGLASALVVWAALFAIFDDFRVALDWGTVLMLSGTLIICTISGAVALLAMLRTNASSEAA